MNIPGFIDLQVNGYAGIDYHNPDITVDEALRVAEICASKGTSGLLATVTTNSKKNIEQCISIITKAIKKQGKQGHILGIHLEGPFISPEYGYRGAHKADSIYPPDLQWFNKLQEIAQGNIRIVTLAPEQNNAEEFIRAVAPEVIVSVGHSNCSYMNVRKAIAAGLTMATHIGNGCVQTIDRHDNPIVNILACPEVTLTFIADSFHLPEAFIRILINSRPIEKLIVISDSEKLAAMPPGRYIASSGKEVILNENGRLCLASDPEVMAGSSSNMIKCMNHLASMEILSENQLLHVGYFNPLNMLGINPEKFDIQGIQVTFDKERKRFKIKS